MSNDVQRMPAIDGLRGIAVLLVIVFHHQLLGVGWVGVQLFFVLSGYLITLGLLRDQALPASQFFAGFYWRRSLRIFPVYFAYLAILAALASVSTKAEGFHTEWPWLLTYAYNWSVLRSDFQFSFWWGHFWSLCVEEQFYLAWPLVVYLARGRLRVTIAAMMLTAPACRAVAATLLAGRIADVGGAIYWLTPSQLDGFAFGAALAAFPALARIERPVWWAVSATSATIAFGSFAVASRARSGSLDFEAWSTFGYQLGDMSRAQPVWSYTVLDATCAAWVLCASQGRLRWLQWSGLRWVGRVSYCAYVVHRAAILVARSVVHRFETPADRLLVLCISLPLTLLVAAASYHWFERRFSALRDRVASPKPAAASPLPSN